MAELPLAVDFAIDPPFVWQGITATLEIVVTNPNTVDVSQVELSDELPAALALLEVLAGSGGAVEQLTSPASTPLLIFRWPSIPAGASASVQMVVQVDSDLADGALIDNLVGVRGANAAYSAGAVTIGMPPVEPPAFD
jgi:uncharacterized repeat protein (TIGR01451 family)